MSDALNHPTEAPRVVTFPRRAGCRIRTEAEALWAIIDNADFDGSEGPYTILKIRADGRLLDYLESYGTAPAA